MQNHKDVAMADFAFATRPPVPSTSTTSTSTSTSPPAVTKSATSSSNSTNSASSESAGMMQPLEIMEPLQQHSTLYTNNNNKRSGPNRNKLRVKQTVRKWGGALNKTLNVAKWIDDLEQDQTLADQLDRINSENVNDQERHDICRQAMEACLKDIQLHLQEYLGDYPQATYEEWICELHPDNINLKLDGLTQTPMIDHRFYVEDSDHRKLWNEHLNDLNDPTNMQPVRHFVPARGSKSNSTSTSTDNNHNHNNETDLFSWDTTTEPFQTNNENRQTPQPTTTEAAAAAEAAVAENNNSNNQNPPNEYVDLLS